MAHDFAPKRAVVCQLVPVAHLLGDLRVVHFRPGRDQAPCARRRALGPLWGPSHRRDGAGALSLAPRRDTLQCSGQQLLMVWKIKITDGGEPGPQTASKLALSSGPPLPPSIPQPSIPVGGFRSRLSSLSSALLLFSLHGIAERLADHLHSQRNFDHSQACSFIAPAFFFFSRSNK